MRFVRDTQGVTGDDLVPYCERIESFSIAQVAAFIVQELDDESVTYLNVSVRERLISQDELLLTLALVLREKERAAALN